MPEEVLSGVYRLPIPLHGSPLGEVNAYAVVAPDGLHLVDCGWDTPQAYDALRTQLAAIGSSIAEIRDIVVTHIHPDHFGLAEFLASESGATVMMHQQEAVYVGARYGDVQTLIADMDEWLKMHGVPSDELDAMTTASLGMLKRVGTRRPDVLFHGQEVLRWGTYSFEVVWTPGHSAGLICLHERQAGILMASDHVLQRISPHVGLHTQSPRNPLADYMESLHRVSDLRVERVLPGHGKPFRNLTDRVRELLRHHEQRLDEMEGLLGDGSFTAYEVAARLPWKGAEDGWQRLAPFQRRMALTETIAHLEFMVSFNRARKELDGSLTVYS